MGERLPLEMIKALRRLESAMGPRITPSKKGAEGISIALSNIPTIPNTNIIRTSKLLWFIRKAPMTHRT